MSSIYQAIETIKGKPVGRVLREGTREEVLPYWVAGKVAIVWRDTTPIRKLSQKSLAKMRKTRLRNRLQKKHPLFADELYDRELTSRPDFYEASDRASA